MTVLRQRLLEGRAVAIAGGGWPLLRETLAGLGARVEAMPALDGADEERVGEWARSRAPLHGLVYVGGVGGGADGGAGGGADGGAPGLDEVLDGAWIAVREIANGALIPDGQGGKIVLIAPPGDGPGAAGLENLARTLSVEWARHGVTVVAVALGPHLRPEDVVEVVAYLVSVAGDYITGTRLELGIAAPPG